MATLSAERTPHEHKTLVFPTPEAAQSFQEKIQENASPESRREPSRQAVSQALANEFTQAGEAVAAVREPWQHSQAEHAEAQRLVDIAFAQDLPAALKTARQSDHYPRNIDLFHDVLTSEMYELLREHKLNQQPLATGILIASLILTVALLVMLVAALLL